MTKLDFTKHIFSSHRVTKDFELFVGFPSLADSFFIYKTLIIVESI